jgi:hypothetical protein
MDVQQLIASTDIVNMFFIANTLTVRFTPTWKSGPWLDVYVKNQEGNGASQEKIRKEAERN